MFQRQRMFLKRRVAIGHGRMAGVAGLGRETEIRHVEPLKFGTLRSRGSARAFLGMAGMQREQQEDDQVCCSEQQELK